METSIQNDVERLQWEGLLDGEGDAFISIYNRYFNLLYGYGMRFCHDREIVKDCIQDLFVKLWCNRNELSVTTVVKPYLFTSLRHTVINRLDKEKRIKERESKSWRAYAFDIQYNAEARLIMEESDFNQTSEILNALDNLPPRQKESIYLRFYAGLEYKEIAEIMQISVKATYKIIGRAIGVMRKYIKEAIIYSTILLLIVSKILF